MVQIKNTDEFIKRNDEILANITRLVNELKQQCLQLELQSIDFKYLTSKKEGE